MIPTETAVWIECDFCGRAYGGPGLTRVVHRVGEAIVCVECQRRPNTSAVVGVTVPREAVQPELTLTDGKRVA